MKQINAVISLKNATLFINNEGMKNAHWSYQSFFFINYASIYVTNLQPFPSKKTFKSL